MAAVPSGAHSDRDKVPVSVSVCSLRRWGWQAGHLAKVWRRVQHKLVKLQLVSLQIPFISALTIA